MDAVSPMMMSTTGPQLLRAGMRQLIANMYHGTGRFKTRLQGKVVILAYHRVLTRRELAAQFVQPGMYVLADVFERQMRFVKENFCTLSIDELFRRWQDRGLDAGNTYCVITFDDGWQDNYVYAYPVLRSLGIPATIFLATGLIGTDEWFWPDKLAYLLRWSRPNGMPSGAPRTAWTAHVEHVIACWKHMTHAEIETELRKMSNASGVSIPRERALLSWEEVAEMSRHGVSFGSHSATHAILTNVTREELKQEVETSLRMLRDRSENAVPVFCYPNGAYTDEVVECVKAAGYVGAVTTDPGCETRSPYDYFRVRRLGVHHDISRTIPLFAFHLAGLNQLLSTKR